MSCGPQILARLARDEEGYLLDPQDWNRDVGIAIAAELEVQMSALHWLVVDFVREQFELNQSVPEARSVLKFLRERLGPQSATRRFLYTLFPYGYGQQACKIAGMRKPRKLMLDV